MKVMFTEDLVLEVADDVAVHPQLTRILKSTVRLIQSRIQSCSYRQHFQGRTGRIAALQGTGKEGPLGISL